MSTGALVTSQLAAYLTAGLGAMSTPKIILFTNAVTPSPEMVYGDLLQPDGDWYTAATCTMGEVFANGDGSVTSVAVSKQFNYSGTDDAETIRGWAVADIAGSGNLYFARSLDEPVTMATELDSVVVQPIITLAAVEQS